MRVTALANGTFEKRLSAREREEPEAIARLKSEARLLELLGGAVTPRIAAAGEDAHGPFFCTERIPFPTLAERFAAPVDPAWLERAATTAFRALADLHAAADDAGSLAIVHADLSPANVAIDDAGTRAVFLDLELASWRDAPPRDGAFRGTVFYCAPEVARGDLPRAASDLFALAATLLHGAIGRPPRTGPSLAALLAVAAETPLPDPAHAEAHARLAARGPGHAAILACPPHDPYARPPSAPPVASPT